MTTIERAGSQFGLILAVLLLGLTLRPSMASIGPALPFIQQEWPLSFTVASLLTVLPVLAMGLGVLWAHLLTKRMSAYQVITLAALAVLAATAARFWVQSAVDLILTAIVTGLGIALVQAVMPLVIKQRFADKAALVMGWYVSAIIAGAALSASVSAYLVELLQSWRGALASWLLLSLIAMLVWALQKKTLKTLPKTTESVSPLQYAKYRRSFALAFFFGLVTCAFTCVLAWLPAYYVEQGWTEQTAGLVLGFMISMEVLSGILSPMIANRLADRRPVLLVLSGLMGAGFIGLTLYPSAGWVWAGLLGLGVGGLFPLSLIVAMDHKTKAHEAATLTAFVQAFGYTLAAFSPLLAGFIRDTTQSFTASWGLLALMSGVVFGLACCFNPKRYEMCFVSK